MIQGSGGTWSYYHLYIFPGGASGGIPSAAVTFGKSALFGGTNGGPTNGQISNGVVYEIRP